MKRKYWCFLIFFSLSSIYAAEFNPSCNSGSATFSANLSCLKEMNVYLNKNMQTTYHSKMQSLTKTQRKVLKKQQKIWKKNLDRECRKYIDVASYGQESYLVALQCNNQKTKHRIAILKNYRANK